MDTVDRFYVLSEITLENEIFMKDERTFTSQ